ARASRVPRAGATGPRPGPGAVSRPGPDVRRAASRLDRGPARPRTAPVARDLRPAPGRSRPGTGDPAPLALKAARGREAPGTRASTTLGRQCGSGQGGDALPVTRARSGHAPSGDAPGLADARQAPGRAPDRE